MLGSPQHVVKWIIAARAEHRIKAKNPASLAMLSLTALCSRRCCFGRLAWADDRRYDASCVAGIDAFLDPQQCREPTSTCSRRRIAWTRDHRVTKESFNGDGAVVSYLNNGRAGGPGGDMLSKEYLDTARTLLRAAQTMTDSRIVGQLKVLAEDYERRAEKASHADTAKALARSADRGNRDEAR
jgi:hypothetical protein